MSVTRCRCRLRAVGYLVVFFWSSVSPQRGCRNDTRGMRITKMRDATSMERCAWTRGVRGEIGTSLPEVRSVPLFLLPIQNSSSLPFLRVGILVSSVLYQQGRGRDCDVFVYEVDFKWNQCYHLRGRLHVFFITSLMG